MSNPRIVNLKSYGGDRSGNVGIFFGVFVGAVAVTVGAMADYGRALTERTEVQVALDAAAIAGATVIGGSETARREAAEKVFAANFTGVGGVHVQPYVDVNGDHVSVSAQALVPTSFARIANVETIEVGATSTALGQGGGPACMVALNETNSNSLHMQGTNKLVSEGCVVHVNSTHEASIDATGSAQASADAFCTAGGSNGESHFTPPPINGCGKVRLGEPFTSLVAPSSSGCDHHNMQVKKQDGFKIVWPGVYCGGLELKTHATVFAMPGVYGMKNGPLVANSDATLTGWSVMFYFTGNNTTLEVMSGAYVELTAPTWGLYKNFLFVQDPNSNPGATTKIQGGGRVELNGILFAPTWVVEVGGNGVINENVDMWSMVADSYNMMGNAEIYIKSTPAADDQLPVSPRKSYLVN